MKVYTKINGKLAMYEVDTLDTNTAIFVVRKELKIKPGGVPVLAVVPKPWQMELDFVEKE